MKRIRRAALFAALSFLFSGCGMGKSEMTVGKDLPTEEIAGFVYTYENINYGAEYLRYRFDTTNGERLFSWEKRERPNGYGPATEQDTVAKGERSLGEEEWTSFCALLRDGTAQPRKESVVSGDSGPWTYLYQNGDETGKEFRFPSLNARTAFEAFCEKLAQN